MKVTNRDRAAHYEWGDGGDAWYRLNTPELSIIEERVPPGGVETPHYHRKSQQTFYVLEGAVTFVSGKKQDRLVAGDSVVVEPGTIHSLVNDEEAPAFLLVISKPESHADRVDVTESQK